MTEIFYCVSGHITYTQKNQAAGVTFYFVLIATKGWGRDCDCNASKERLISINHSLINFKPVKYTFLLGLCRVGTAHFKNCKLQSNQSQQPSQAKPGRHPLLAQYSHTIIAWVDVGSFRLRFNLLSSSQSIKYQSIAISSFHSISLQKRIGLCTKMINKFLSEFSQSIPMQCNSFFLRATMFMFSHSISTL